MRWLRTRPCVCVHERVRACACVDALLDHANNRLWFLYGNENTLDKCGSSKAEVANTVATGGRPQVGTHSSFSQAKYKSKLLHLGARRYSVPI